MAARTTQLQKGCYYEWMRLQDGHIADLKEALMRQQSNENDRKLVELVGKIVNDFEKYAERRSELSHGCWSNYVAPSWNSSLENGLLWMGGCRPSSFFRVIYAMCGSHAETQLSQYLSRIDDNVDDDDANDRDGSMSDLVSTQLAKINELHIKVINEEDKITKKFANLQEDVADMPIAVTAYGDDSVNDDVAVEDALNKYEGSMAVLMVEAEKLRFETLRKIVEVMTPVQAAEFLLAGKRLNLSLHKWGRVREDRHVWCARAEDTAATRAGAGKLKKSSTC